MPLGESHVTTGSIRKQQRSVKRSFKSLLIIDLIPALSLTDEETGSENLGDLTELYFKRQSNSLCMAVEFLTNLHKMTNMLTTINKVQLFLNPLRD